MQRKNTNFLRSLFLGSLLLAALSAATAGTANAQAQYRRALDFDGDGKADFSVARSETDSSLTWYSYRSSNGSLQAARWGLYNGGPGYGYRYDKLAPGDYDGDGKADYCVVRRNATNNLVWYILQSSNGQVRYETFGLGAADVASGGYDKPMAADYDGDGKTDVAVARFGSSAQLGSYVAWYILRSTDRGVQTKIVPYSATQYGVDYDSISVGDYDGDNKADYTLYAADNAAQGKVFLISRSSDGVMQTVPWGLKGGVYGGDRDVPGDYDGDGKTDIAVVRLVPNGGDANYVWYIRRSSDGSLLAAQFGNLNSDHVTCPADYDGDGKADIAVRSKSSGSFVVLKSTGGVQFFQWGYGSDFVIRLTEHADSI